MSEKTTFHHGNLKNEIMTQGLKIIDESGFRAVELKEIATLCDVSSPSIYRHFKGKSDLMATLLVKVSYDFYSFLDSERNQLITNPEEKLVQLGVRFLLYAQEHRHYFEFLFYSEYERHVELDSSAHIDNYDEHNSFNLFKEAVIQYLNYYGIMSNYNKHIINLWAYISGLAEIAEGINSDNKNKTLENYIQDMIKIYTLSIRS
ncbi:TetR/AcrR family transcriptional regulator [Leuconostoc gelidum subsp. gasicomitatum]|uniref:TetR/AcrR family transcriptional regulator n=1 Tax=Leuconostoc gasicomitatum TaxID=115778 RepID=UPI001CC4FB4A|nr:TetR/AcrR family transcriptional regulator [Leuconostoc gasicomitatum]MBZ5983744.1 TetR/AcrR family transcriptional regulator [Leuconostoc gasicomitatum]